MEKLERVISFLCEFCIYNQF